MTNTDSMTPEQIRRAIAERLGYSEHPLEMERMIASWKGRESTTTYYDEDPMTQAGVPDWSHDDAAALDLCRELIQDWDWMLTICKDNLMQIGPADFPTLHEAQANTPALALCRLWLAATEGDDDE